VIRPEIHFVKYRHLYFLLKFIYILIFVKDFRFDLRYDHERLGICRKVGI